MLFCHFFVMQGVDLRLNPFHEGKDNESEIATKTLNDIMRGQLM